VPNQLAQQSYNAQVSVMHQQAIMLNDPSAAIPFNSNSNARGSKLQDENELTKNSSINLQNHNSVQQPQSSQNIQF
jgi:hypothetical protein